MVEIGGFEQCQGPRPDDDPRERLVSSGARRAAYNAGLEAAKRGQTVASNPWRGTGDYVRGVYERQWDRGHAEGKLSMAQLGISYA